MFGSKPHHLIVSLAMVTSSPTLVHRRNAGVTNLPQHIANSFFANGMNVKEGFLANLTVHALAFVMQTHVHSNAILPTEPLMAYWAFKLFSNTVHDQMSLKMNFPCE